MAKKLTTTVHITGEDGETRVLGPKSKLTAADRKELEDRWGKRSSEYFEDDDDEPEDVSQEDHQKAGHPLADSGPSEGSDALKDAEAIRAKARTDAAVKAAEDAGNDPKDLTRKGGRNVGG